MDIWSRLLSHRVLSALYKVVIFTQLCDDSRKPPLSVSEPSGDGNDLAVVFVAMFSLLSSPPPSLSPSPLPLSPCPWLRCWSQMQLASQKGQQTCGHRESGSCQGRLSWGCPSSRAVWVSWQREGWRDSETESERGRTSVRSVVGLHKTLTSEVAETGHLLYPCVFL